MAVVKEYKILNKEDGNDQIILKSTKELAAYEEALNELGWYLVMKETVK